MITAQALALCIFAAAQTYSVPAPVLLGILHVEGGRVGQAVKNTNNTHDLGPMQINTIWMPELARHWGVSEGKATQMVRDDACINIGVGAWILRTKMNDTGSLYQGIAWYHSATPKHGHKYRDKVLAAMQNYRLVREPADLVRAHERQQQRRTTQALQTPAPRG
jgi:soluble lytic murein transglycosylase-like protein